MKDLALTVLQSPALYGLALLLGIYFILTSPTAKRRYPGLPPLIRSHYWKVMLATGLLLGGLAIVLYLAEIAHSVMGLVDRLQAAVANPDARADDLRNLATATAVLLGALAASATLVFQLVRVWITERTTTATEEGLVTDRINKAVEGLGAEKSVSRVWRNVTYTLDGTEHTVFEGRDESTKLPSGVTAVKCGEWTIANRTTPNLEVRLGAIYALERIAQDSPRDHVQIMEILCAYIRQNAPADEAPPWPELEMKESEIDGPLEEDWEDRLKAFRQANSAAKATLKVREDVQTALTVIGRRSPAQRTLEARANGNKTPFVFDIPCPEPDLPTHRQDKAALSTYEAELAAWQKQLHAYRGYRLDLRHANLRGADLSGFELAGARLDGVRMQGANLGEARMQGAYLLDARMQGAYLLEARIQGANLRGARMQGADLGGAQMQETTLWAAQIQAADLEVAEMQGANLGSAQMQGAYLGGAQLEGAYLLQARMQGAYLGEARFDSATSLSAASLRGAALRQVDCNTDTFTADQLAEAFGDASVKNLPKGLVAGTPPLGHWSDQDLDLRDFNDTWRAWQKTLAPDPTSPTPPHSPPR